MEQDLRQGTVDKKTHKRAVRFLAKKFGLKKSDFRFHAVWVDEFMNCVLYNIVNPKSSYYKSTVGFEL